MKSDTYRKGKDGDWLKDAKTGRYMHPTTIQPTEPPFEIKLAALRDPDWSHWWTYGDPGWFLWLEENGYLDLLADGVFLMWPTDAPEYRLSAKGAAWLKEQEVGMAVL